MSDNLTLQQLGQPDLGGPSVITARCGSNACRHEWIVAHLPMPLDKAAMLMARAACPKCAHERPELAHD